MEIPVQPPIQTPPPPEQQPPVQQPTPPVQSLEVTPSSPKSQKKLLLALVFLILAVISGIGVYFMNGSSPSNIKNTPSIPASPIITQKVIPTDTLLPTGTGEAQLDQDIQNIDSTIGTAASDLTNIEQGLNDQPLDLME